MLSIFQLFKFQAPPVPQWSDGQEDGELVPDTPDGHPAQHPRSMGTNWPQIRGPHTGPPALQVSTSIKMIFQTHFRPPPRACFTLPGLPPGLCRGQQQVGSGRWLYICYRIQYVISSIREDSMDQEVGQPCGRAQTNIFSRFYWATWSIYQRCSECLP